MCLFQQISFVSVVRFTQNCRHNLLAHDNKKYWKDICSTVDLNQPTNYIWKLINYCKTPKYWRALHLLAVTACWHPPKLKNKDDFQSLFKVYRHTMHTLIWNEWLWGNLPNLQIHIINHQKCFFSTIWLDKQGKFSFLRLRHTNT